MSVIAAGLAQALGEGAGPHVLENAKQLASKVLLPQRITGTLIAKYIRKAMQAGAWLHLPREARALLFLARRLTLARSPVLTEVLRRLLLEIELHTTRGQAVLYGIIVALKQAPGLLKNLTNTLHIILYLGISYINNPPHLRIYG